MHSAIDLPTQSICVSRSSTYAARGWVTLGGGDAASALSSDGTRGGQIGSTPDGDAALESREASKGEGEADDCLHLGGDVGEEDEAGVGCH